MNWVALPRAAFGGNDAASPEQAPPSAFERTLLTQRTFKAWLARLVFNHMDPLFALMRFVAPISIHLPLMLNGRPTWFACITRAENVRDVLGNNAIFNVPYNPKLESLSGNGFLLGRDRCEEHQTDLKIAVKAFPLSDIPKLARFAAALADDRMSSARAAAGDFDVITQLARPVLTKICRAYLGIAIDADDFPYWAMAVSAYLIEPLGTRDPVASGQAEAGARLLIDSIRRSRGSIREWGGHGETERIPGLAETVLMRLVSAGRRNDGTPDNGMIEALLCGVIAAIIPTGVLAVGHIMEMLLRRPDMMTASQRAARSGDPELLRRCLFEVLRFKPIIPVWPRICAGDFHLAVTSKRSHRIKAQRRVLVSTQSAMHDPRQISDPGRFNPMRPASDYLHFGAGLHACLGAAIASAVIPAIVGPLLLHRTIVAGTGRRSFYAAVFPESFPVTIKG
jgi:cytochrome P450